MTKLLREEIRKAYWDDVDSVVGAGWADDVACLEEEIIMLREFADHRGYCRAQMRKLGDVCICGYTDALLRREN